MKNGSFFVPSTTADQTENTITKSNLIQNNFHPSTFVIKNLKFFEIKNNIKIKKKGGGGGGHDTGSLINLDMAQTLQCTLDNRAAGKMMPAVTVDGAAVEEAGHLRYLGIHFNIMLTYKHVEQWH